MFLCEAQTHFLWTTGSHMEYTFTPAIYRNQQIIDNTFDRDWTQCRSPFVDTSYIVQLLLTCVCGVSRLTELLSRNIHSPLISCRIYVRGEHYCNTNTVGDSIVWIVCSTDVHIEKRLQP